MHSIIVHRFVLGYIEAVYIKHTYLPSQLVDILQELARGHHDKVEAFLDNALAISIDIGDPITRVSLPSKAYTLPFFAYC